MHESPYIFREESCFMITIEWIDAPGEGYLIKLMLTDRQSIAPYRKSESVNPTAVSEF